MRRGGATRGTTRTGLLEMSSAKAVPSDGLGWRLDTALDGPEWRKIVERGVHREQSRVAESIHARRRDDGRNWTLDDYARLQADSKKVCQSVLRRKKTVPGDK